MYNSNPSQAPFPPLSLLDRSLRVMTGAVGWREATHSAQTHCAHTVQTSFDLSYFQTLLHSLALSLFVIPDRDRGKKGSLYNFVRNENAPQNMTLVCKWLVVCAGVGRI